MACSSCFIISFVSISIIFIGLSSTPTAEAQNDDHLSSLIAVCSTNTSVFSKNSTYHRNLYTLLSTLSSKSSDYANGFGNGTVGQLGSSGQAANGLFLCRADVSSATCQACVSFAAQEILEKCPGRKAAIIWYDQCMLRYSNNSISSIMRENPMFSFYNLMNVSEPLWLATLLNQTFTTLLPRAAASGQSGKKFAAEKKANFASNETLYVFAQCSTDLTEFNCTTCLNDITQYLPTYPVGARVLSPSCNVRYETYPFYNESALALLSPVPSPTSPLPSAPSPTAIGQPKSSARESSVGAAQAVMALISVSFFFSLLFLVW